MDDGALNDALETGGWLRIVAIVDHQARELVVYVVLETSPQDVKVDTAGAHDCRRVLVVHERQQEVLEGCIFVAALIGERERAMKGLFETARECWHEVRLLLFHGAL
jgi:hypothetical protein